MRLSRATAAAVTAAALLRLGSGLFRGAATSARTFRGAATASGGFAFGRAATAFGFAGATTPTATAAAFLVRMAVGEFREFRRAHGNNFNIKGQRLASELMVAVEDRFLLVDVTDNEHAHAEIGFGVEAHPDLHFVRTEAIDRNALDQRVAVFTIRIDGLHDDGLSVARGEAFEALLQSRDDIAGAVEILHRAMAGRRVEHVTLVVLEGVFDADDGFFGDAHVSGKSQEKYRAHPRRQGEPAVFGAPTAAGAI